MDNENFSNMFAPLETVDTKSLTFLAEKMQKSLSKTEKAVGSFLLRYIDSKSGTKKSSGRPVSHGNHDLSKLRDLP